MSFLDHLLGRQPPATDASPMGFNLDGGSGGFSGMDAPQQQAGERYNYSPNRLVNGGLRDLLGALADAHAESQGMDPLYRNKRANEEASEALQDFQSDPMGAVQRLAKKNPSLAQKFYNDYLEQERNKTAQSRADNTAANDGLIRTRNARQLIGGLMRSARGPDAQAAARSQAEIIAGRAGVDLSDLPDPSDTDGWANWVNGTMPVKDQKAAEYHDTRANQIDRQQGERERHNQVAEGQAGEKIKIDRGYKTAQIHLGGGRLAVQAGNAVAGANNKGAGNVEKARHNKEAEALGLERLIASKQARITRQYPDSDVVFRRHKTHRGVMQFTTDGGKTWQEAN